MTYRRRHAAAAAAFSMGNLPNLYAYFTARLGVAQTGGLVDSWTDQSVSGFVAAMTVGNRPGYVAADTDGKPKITINGVNQWLQTSTNFGVTTDTYVTTYALVRPNSNASGALMALFGWGSNAGSASAFAPFVNYPGAAQPSIQTAGGNGVAFGTTPVTTQWQLFCFEKAPGPLTASSSCRRNNVDVSPASGSAAVPSYAAAPLYIGQFAASGYNFNGDIRMLAVSLGGRLHTDSEKTNVYNLMQSEYGPF